MQSITIIIILFISLALKGIHKRLGLYKGLTHSQGNLEANSIIYVNFSHCM